MDEIEETISKDEDIRFNFYGFPPKLETLLITENKEEELNYIKKV